MERRSIVPISFLVNLKHEMSKFPLFRATLAVYRSCIMDYRKQGKRGIHVEGRGDPRDSRQL